MTRWMVLGFLALSLVAPALAQDAEGGEKTSKEALKARIERLIGTLGAEEWKVRVGAMKELVRIGKPAVPGLEKAAKSEDPEVRVRAKQALDAILEVERKASERAAAGKEGPSPRKGKPEPFPVPDPWNRDFAKWMKKMLENPFGPGREWEDDGDRKAFDRLRRLLEKDWRLGDAEKVLKEVEELLRDGRGPWMEWDGSRKITIRRDGKTIEVERDAGGKITVVIRRKGEDGRTEEKRYSAASEEAFRKQYPEVFKEFVKGRLSRRGIRVLPGGDPFKDMTKKFEKEMKRFRERWDPEGMRKEMEERMRRFREGWRDRARDFGSHRVVVTRKGERIELERRAGGGVSLVLRRRDENGNMVEDRFEAGSEAEFKVKFPKIHKKYLEGALGRNGIRIEVGPGFDFGKGFFRKPKVRAGIQEGRKLGIRPGDVSDVMRVHLDIEEGVGFVVNEVAPGSGAERAGIRKWDLILKAAGRRVVKPSDIEEALEGADGPIELELIRRGERMTLRLGK